MKYKLMERSEPYVPIAFVFPGDSTVIGYSQLEANIVKFKDRGAVAVFGAPLPDLDIMEADAHLATLVENYLDLAKEAKIIEQKITGVENPENVLYNMDFVVQSLPSSIARQGKIVPVNNMRSGDTKGPYTALRNG